ncbi:hypothetical protein HZ994_18585 [Akkermansiaceae bacterium]|nr:hypothetical protein HZ994_18585 [Akkermansiaceae bacterium]
MKKPAAVLIATLLLAFNAFAQNNNGGTNADPDNPNANGPTDREVRNGYWEANLAGGNYLVALGRISSVSRHKYVLDGTLIVDEVTVDTTGQALARFYFITPITATGVGAAASDAAERALALVDGAARRAGTEVQDMVVKKYPLTTHSKTIEYRLLSEQQLNGLYSSVRTAWVTGKGRVFTSR